MDRKKYFSHFSHLSEARLERLRHAYWLAKEAHRPQLRDDGRRYFEHPRDVSSLLLARGHNGCDINIKALLHDTPEDTFTPPSLIRALFGEEVLASSLRLSKIERTFDPLTGYVTRSRKKSDEEYWQGVAEGTQDDRLVKCADRHINLGDMRNWDTQRRLRYAAQTEQWVIPVARATDTWFYDELRRMVDDVRTHAPVPA